MTRTTTRKWLEFVRFELAFQFTRKSTWFFFAIVLIPLIGITGEQLMDADRTILFHSPLLRAENSVLMTLVAFLVMAAVTGDAATRDIQTRLEPLMQAAPFGRAEYVGGRFLGAFGVAAILLSAVPLVHLVLPMLRPGAELVGSVRPEALLQSYFLLILPNAFVATALMFSLATFVRHSAGSYAAAALLFAALQFNVSFLAEGLGLWNLATLLDPTGLTPLGLMSDTWSPIEANERLIGSDPSLLLNRLIWLSVASAVIVFAAGRFDFGKSIDAPRWWQRGRHRVIAPALGHQAGGDTGALARGAVARSVPTATPPRDFGTTARARQMLAVARDSLREVAGWSWLLVPAFALKVTGNLNMLETLGAGTAVLPTTHLVLTPVEYDAPPLALAVLMFPALLAGELLWRERDANLQALADTAPVPDGVRFMGKVLALGTVFVVLHVLLMLAGVTTQVLRGWYDFDLLVYGQILGVRLANALLFALFALSVHVLVNQKHVAHLITLAAVLGPRLAAEFLGIEHPMLLLGYAPSWRHSPISGFGPFLGPVLSFQLYWAAWAALLAVCTRLFWVRGVERGFVERVRLARHRFRGRMAGTAVGVLAVLLLAGGWVFYNTNILSAYRSSAEGLERLARYERSYGRYRTTPQPRLAGSILTVEIQPDRREADIRGVHRLVNQTGEPIDTIHIATSPEVTTEEIEFGRPARAAVLDDDLSHRIYVFEEPLQPGDSLSMNWRVRHSPRGFSEQGLSTAVVGNGSFILMSTWAPNIGYQPRREMANAGDRREHGLPERRAIPAVDDLQARLDPGTYERLDLDVTIATAADQIAVAPGALVERWERDGRAYFHYVTDAPIGNEYAIFSADYAVRRARWGDVALEVFHHPEHDGNVDRIVDGMQASLEQFTRRFGPYPHSVLRFVEYPSAGGSLHAAEANVWYQELFSLFDPDRESREIDLPFAVVGHEVAHQFQPASAMVEGRSLLSESFAWYAALGVIEQEHGVDHLRRVLGFMREAYRDPRSLADVPLLRASDFFLGYRKGPFAMYALQEYIGQDNVDLAWRRLRERHASFQPPLATSFDLYRELQEVTPDSLQYLLADLIERNTFWELRTDQATSQPIASGEWETTLRVVARKAVVDTMGVETDMPMDDLIEIGVFAPADDGQLLGRPLYLAMHRVRPGPQTISVRVRERPARAGIDPRHLLIDLAPNDNFGDIP